MGDPCTGLSDPRTPGKKCPRGGDYGECRRCPKFDTRLVYVDSELLKATNPTDAWIKEIQQAKQQNLFLKERAFLLKGPLCNGGLDFNADNQLRNFQEAPESAANNGEKRAKNLDSLMRTLTGSGNVKLMRRPTRFELQDVDKKKAKVVDLREPVDL